MFPVVPRHIAGSARNCVEFRGKVFFMYFGVCAELDAAVFIKFNGGPCHELLRRDRARPLFTGSA